MSEKNTYGLPRGDKIRRELRAWFRAQRRAVLHYVGTGEIRTKDESGGDVPPSIPDFDAFGLGSLPMSERMAPLIGAIWDDAGQSFNARLGLDPDSFSVTNPNTREAVNRATLEFCESTNATTHLELTEALRKTREAISEGLIARGDSVADLTKRINDIFSGAETWRARRIAATEASRAVHAAQEMSAVDSGVVTGWKWLLSADACPLCQTVARRVPAVRIGGPFAVIGNNPAYATISHPPLHPGCQCSLQEVLDIDPQPEWAAPLVDPEPEEQDYAEGEAPRPKQPRPPAVQKPKPAPKVKPKPKTFESELDERMSEAKDSVERHVILEGLIEKWAKPSGPSKTHGMSRPEEFSKLSSGGIEWLFAKGREEAVNNAIRINWEYRDSIPKRLIESTKKVWFCNQENEADRFWRQAYRDFTKSNATGGNGEIMIYEGGEMMLGTLSHESGHNLAGKLYFSTDPKNRPGSDYARSLESDESPISEYALNSGAEDFAESCRAYVQTRSKFAERCPRRFEIIDRLMKDPTYGG